MNMDNSNVDKIELGRKIKIGHCAVDTIALGVRRQR
jgi:hypothetical protein